MPKEPALKPDEAPEAPQSDDLHADEEGGEPLPSHKDDLVAVAIERGIPSYEAWAMTVPELTEKLES